ncbi:hypothetical protein LZC95_19700 [Pendulispora brunnea]|uniref:Uncharacterized protein n=1 Tax=Pendulispora brunnea TaxID=2905690 RepID=A0ABZ2KK52_9BACT
MNKTLNFEVEIDLANVNDVAAFMKRPVLSGLLTVDESEPQTLWVCASDMDHARAIVEQHLRGTRAEINCIRCASEVDERRPHGR